VHIGWRRLRQAAASVVWVGIAGTFVTAAALAVLVHALFDLTGGRHCCWAPRWLPPTRQWCFLMLGRREVAGRSGTILEGESGANDPVGIALLASLPAAGPAAGLDATGSVADAFLLQLAVGAAVGVAGGVLLVGFIRRVPLPSEGLYPLRVLAGALVICGAAALAHGSGFLAVLSPASWPVTPAPLQGGDRTISRALASLPRSWRLWSWASPSACIPCLTAAPWGWV
jgi:potassium/hydrogen antiporter